VNILAGVTDAPHLPELHCASRAHDVPIVALFVPELYTLTVNGPTVAFAYPYLVAIIDTTAGPASGICIGIVEEQSTSAWNTFVT
jgi:hypothetical protein